ncbi:MAG TPA: metallophosphoesterase family protein [Solirubrobacteraceae bacterium]|nr:metallophosphoesterase family protein [Solirubrobacteraceae bacterium]
MRLGVFADVHANLHALDVVLGALEAEGAQRLVCAGDLVGYGPRPVECVRRIGELGVPCVAGNHDLIAIGRLEDDDCIALARRSLRWTASELDDAATAALAALPWEEAVEGVAVAHGSPGDPREYVTTAARARELLAALDAGAAGLVLGHTHLPMLVAERSGSLLGADGAPPGDGATVALPPGERFLLNPGAVGQSRERVVRARAAVLDLERREVRFLALPYDHAAVAAELRERGLSPRGVHLPPPSRLRRAGRTAAWYWRWAGRKLRRR